MREIMFRIWNKTTHSMHYEKDLKEIKNSIVKEFATNMDFKLIPNHKNNRIMQFTGLKDKNGTEIYEGDIIKVIRKHWNNCGKEYLEKITEEVGEVVFYKNWQVSLKTKEKEGTLYQPFLWMFEDEEDYEVEVIGNIYENPELLGGAENE